MKKKLQILAGIAIALLLVWLVFKDTEWPAVGRALREANGWWLLLSLVLCFVTFVTRVQRWSYIVRNAEPVSFRVLFSATQIGFLANFTLLGRVGEVIRAVVLARLTSLTFSRCFAFVALDRVTDLFGLMAVMLISILFFNPSEPVVIEELNTTIQPNLIRLGAFGTGVAMAAIIGAFVLLYLNKALAVRIVAATVGRVSSALSEKLEGMVEQFADGFQVFKSIGDMSRAIAWSLVTWAVGTLCYFCVLEAFAIDAPWYTAVVVMACLAVAISVPSTPGFVGLFHFAILAALLVVAPQTNTDVAKAAAIVAHLVNVIPVLIAGGICLYTEDLGLFELRRQGEAAESESAPT